MKKTTLATLLVFLAGLGYVLYGDAFTKAATDTGQTYTFHFADEAHLLQGIQRIQRFEAELRDEGFREVSEALSNDQREVTLKGRYGRLGRVEVRLWTNTNLAIEEPHIGAEFDAAIGDDAAKAAWETLNDRFKQAVYGEY